MQRERFGIEQLVPILPHSKRAGCLTLIINSRGNQCIRLCLVHPFCFMPWPFPNVVLV